MSFGIWAKIVRRMNRKKVYSSSEYWDEKAQFYEGSSVSMWENSELNNLYMREQRHALESAIGDVLGKRVLDLGCGTGRFSHYLASLGAQVVGIDFSADSIKLARTDSSAHNPQFRVESVFDFNHGEHYDLVVSVACLTVACESKRDLRRALKNIQASIVPGGQIVLLEPFHDGFLSRVLECDVSNVARTLEYSGFEVDAVVPLHFWPIRLVLAYSRSIPPSVTRGLYEVGQRVMKVKPLGDYTLISAFSSCR